VIWSDNGRWDVIDVVELEVTDSWWLRNSHLKWYWEGIILECMWIYSICDSSGCPMNDINVTIGCGSVKLLMISERIGIPLILWRFWTELSSDINDVKLENLCHLSTWFVMILEAHNNMISDIWNWTVVYKCHIHLICGVWTFINVYRLGHMCFSFPGWYCGQCHKRGSRN